MNLTMAEQFKEKSKTADSKMLFAFSGFLKCAMQCDGDKVLDEEVLEIKKYFNKPGMCQVYRNSEGVYIVMITEDMCYISTYPGEYKHEYDWHTIKCPKGLFIFEQDDSLVEQATLAMIDLVYLVKERSIRMNRKELMKSFIQRIFEYNDPEDDDDYDEDDKDYDDEDDLK